MEVSLLHAVQSLPLSTRSRVFFLTPDYMRENAVSRKSSRLVFASVKESDRNLCLDSKGLLHVWKNKEREGILIDGFRIFLLPSLGGVHRCPIICVDYYLSYIWIPHVTCSLVLYGLDELHKCASYLIAYDSTKHSQSSTNFRSGRSRYMFGKSKIGKEILQVEMLLDNVKWDEKGLAVAIAQNIDTGAILMQGFANRDALATTISSRKATFYSRSRSSLWTKGETSKNFINIHDIYLDCDRDSIIYLGKPDGPTCHTGSETCYYTSVNDYLEHKQTDGSKLALTTLYSLESTISLRKAELTEPLDGKPSWTKRLLQNNELLCSKIREEADELCRTLEENEISKRTASEMGDVIYHAMVLLALKDVKIEDVIETLRLRFAKSGIEEKKSRGKPN